MMQRRSLRMQENDASPVLYGRCALESATDEPPRRTNGGTAELDFNARMSCFMFLAAPSSLGIRGFQSGTRPIRVCGKRKESGLGGWRFKRQGIARV